MPRRQKKSTLPTIPPTETCNGILRNGLRHCRLRAGFRTDHVGEGRCSKHGGCTVVKHGRYSKMKHVALRELVEQFADDPAPLDILPELAAARALFQDFIDRYQQWRDALVAWHQSYATGDAAEKPRLVLDISDAYRLLSEATKIVERIEKIRSADAISRPELNRVMSEMGRVVETVVTDEARREKIRDGWLGIRVS